MSKNKTSKIRNGIFSILFASLALILSSCLLNPDQKKSQSNHSSGNLLSNQIFYNEDKIEGVTGGVIILNNLAEEPVGKYMGREDIIYTQNIIIMMETDQNYHWTNQHRHVTYTVKSWDKGFSNPPHTYCRKYQITAKKGDEINKGSGKLCRDSRGKWFVKA